jgi:hypothetical protein
MEIQQLNKVHNSLINAPTSSKLTKDIDNAIHIYQSQNNPAPPTTKQDTTIISDPTNPSNYCRSCKYYFKTFALYRNHLLNIHQMFLL